MTPLPDDPPESRPTTLGSALALAWILGACVAGSAGPLQSAPFLLEAAGLATFAGGVVWRRRGRPVAGRALTVLGMVVVASALVGAVALSPPPAVLLPTLACGVGAALVTLGTFPVYVGGARALALAGVALAFVGVTANAVVADPPIWRSAAAVTMALLSWDAADRAIVLGERIGADAETASVELTGATASATVAIAAIVLTVAASRVPVGNVSPLGLGLILFAVVALLLALVGIPRTTGARE